MESGKLIQHGKPEDIVLKPKTQYVKDFVAHTNPLNVLKGRSLMQPLASLNLENNRLLICEQKELWIEQKEEGIAVVNSPEDSLVEWGEKDSDWSEIHDSTLVTASPNISMRDAIQLKKLSDYPILLVEDGQLIGLLNDSEFYNALLGKFQPHQAA